MIYNSKSKSFICDLKRIKDSLFYDQEFQFIQRSLMLHKWMMIDYKKYKINMTVHDYSVLFDGNMAEVEFINPMTYHYGIGSNNLISFDYHNDVYNDCFTMDDVQFDLAYRGGIDLPTEEKLVLISQISEAVKDIS